MALADEYGVDVDGYGGFGVWPDCPPYATTRKLKKKKNPSNSYGLPTTIYYTQY